MIIRDNIVLTRSDGNIYLMNLVTFRRKILETKFRDLIYGIKEKALADYTPEETRFVDHLEAEGQFLTPEQLALIEEEVKNNHLHRVGEKNMITPLLILTYACNTHCIYCYQRKRNKLIDDDQIMTSAHIDGIHEFYQRYADFYNLDENYHITITGGEPLLPETKSVLDYIFSKWSTAQFAFVTNGINLAEMIHDLPLSRISRFKISLDGVEEVHNKRRPTPGVNNPFAQVIRGIEASLEHKIPVMLKITVDRETVWQLPELFDFLESKGWLTNSLINLGVTGVITLEGGTSLDPKFNDTREMMESQIQLRRKDSRFACLKNNTFYGLGKLRNIMLRPLNKRIMPDIYACNVLSTPNYTFDPSGFIYLCTDFVGQEAGTLGTFYPEVKLNQEKVLKLRERHIFAMTNCQKCNFRFICAGGCPGTALKKGDIMSEACSYYKNRYIMENISELFL